MKLKRKLLGAAAILVVLPALQTNAQSIDLNVTAEVPEACTILSSDPLLLDFGTVDPVNGAPGNYTVNASFDYQCSAGTQGTITLDLGGGAGATVAQRVMTGPTDTLAYRLETAGGADWGNGSNGAAGVAFTATGFGTTDSEAIVGELLLTDIQAADVGAYTDTVTVTIVL